MKSILASIVFPALAACQIYGGGTSTTAAAAVSSTPASTSTAAGSVPTIVVAQGGLTFTPNSVTAPMGSQVVFKFANAGHTVTQASFDAPCVPSNATGAINSGLSTASGNEQFFTVDITSTNPIWFYCAQTGHCQGGMVGVINAPTDGSNTLDQFTAAAKNAPVSNNIPSNVQGGTYGSSAGASSATSASASASSTAKPNAASKTLNQETILVTMGLVMISLWFSIL